MYHAETLIYEIPLHQSPSLTLGETSIFRRHQFLQGCLEAAKSAVENEISSGTPQYSGTSFYPLMHSMHGVQILYRLSLLEEPGWDTADVHHSANVMGYLEQLALLLERVHGHLAAQTGVTDSTWLMGAHKLRGSLPKWSAALDNAGVTSMHGHDVLEFDETMLDFSNDSWFTDFLSTAAWNA